MNTMEFQDTQIVFTKMNTMKSIFDQYLKLVEAMNEVIEDNINNGNESALDSFLGADFKTTWETLYDDFKQLNTFFEGIYRDVAATTENNVELQEKWAAACGYNYSGSTANTTPPSTTTNSGATRGGGASGAHTITLNPAKSKVHTIAHM